MATPIPSLDSSINIRLDSAPKVADPAVYEALLAIHNAIEVLVRKYDSITSGLSPGTSPGIVATTIIAGDGATEAGGININGTNYNATVKVSDIFGINQSQLILHRHSTLQAPGIIGARSNSNTSAHAAVTANQELLFAQAVGYAGTSYKLFGSFSFKADSTGVISETSAPGKFVLTITPNGGLTPVDVVTVVNSGNVTLAKQLVAPNIGVGVATPTALMHIAAGTAAANTAPIKLTSGVLNTASEAGAVEFLSDKLYFTITTGAVRKELTLNTAALTVNRVPIVTSDGSLTDSAELTFLTDTLTATKLKSLNPVQQITTGAAPVAGNATLVAGTVTVSTTAVKTASVVMLTRKTSGGTIGTAITYTISNGVSFTINSDNILDTSTFSWLIVDTY